MANFNTQPISQLTLANALNGNDVIPIVDVTDNTQSPSGTTKKCPVSLISSSILTSPTITGNATFNGNVTINGTLTGAYHPTRSADFSMGEGAAMLTTDANGIVVSTNTSNGTFIPLYSSTGLVPLGFSTKIVMGNTGHVQFVSEGADNIRNAASTTTLTTQYSTGTLTLISNGNWLLEISST